MGGPGLLNPSTFYGLDLTVGVTFALLAFVESEFIAVPILLRAVRMVREMVASGAHEPPPEFLRTMRLAKLTAFLSLILLFLTSICMVGAGFYWLPSERSSASPPVSGFGVLGLLCNPPALGPMSYAPTDHSTGTSGLQQPSLYPGRSELPRNKPMTPLLATSGGLWR